MSANVPATNRRPRKFSPYQKVWFAFSTVVVLVVALVLHFNDNSRDDRYPEGLNDCQEAAWDWGLMMRDAGPIGAQRLWQSASEGDVQNEKVVTAIGNTSSFLQNAWALGGSSLVISDRDLELFIRDICTD